MRCAALTVDHALIRGLVTAGPQFVVELPRSRFQRRMYSADSTFEGSPTVTVPPALLSIGCGYLVWHLL
jgi:hypothetical protein